MGMRGRPRKTAISGEQAAGSTAEMPGDDSKTDTDMMNREQRTGDRGLPSPVMSQPVRILTTELDGFRVFEPKRNLAGEDVIQIVINQDGCRITQRCAEVLKGPDYVIAFFDEKGKRLMLKPAEKGMANAMELTTKSTKIYPSRIKLSSFRNELLRVAGINPKCLKKFAASGHQAAVIQPTLIFDLGHLQVRE